MAYGGTDSIFRYLGAAIGTTMSIPHSADAVGAGSRPSMRASLGDVRFEPRYGLQLFDELLLLARLGAHIDCRLLRRSRRFYQNS